MFRKVAIALVAASVLGAPVLAQQTTTTPNDSKAPPSTSAPGATTPETSEKTVTKTTKHRVVTRHHRHAKMAKSGKSHMSRMAKHGKPGAKYGKYTRHMSRGSTNHAYGKAGSKPATKPGAARHGLD
jgi:hypothetical protein